MDSLKNIKKICAYCGAANQVSQRHLDDAFHLGQIIADLDKGLVYGGGRTGMMGQVAKGTLDKGGHVIGVIPDFLDDVEIGFREVQDFRLVPDMHTRKMMMFDEADAFVVMPGGLGTLEEMFEVVTWRQLGQHSKPVLIANFDGYWTPLLNLIQQMQDQGYLHGKLEGLMVPFDTPEELPTALIKAIEMPQTLRKW